MEEPFNLMFVKGIQKKLCTLTQINFFESLDISIPKSNAVKKFQGSFQWQFGAHFLPAGHLPYHARPRPAV